MCGLKNLPELERQTSSPLNHLAKSLLLLRRFEEALLADAKDAVTQIFSERLAEQGLPQ